MGVKMLNNLMTVTTKFKNAFSKEAEERKLTKGDRYEELQGAGGLNL